MEEAWHLNTLWDGWPRTKPREKALRLPQPSLNLRKDTIAPYRDTIPDKIEITTLAQLAKVEEVEGVGIMIIVEVLAGAVKMAVNNLTVVGLGDGLDVGND